MISLRSIFRRRSTAASAPRGRIVPSSYSPGPRPANPDMMRYITPAAQTRWLGQGVAWYSPQEVENVFRLALAGDLVSQWEMFDLMEATWPRLAKNLNQIKDSVIANGFSIIPWRLKDQEPTPEAIARADLVDQLLRQMRPKPDADENDLNDTIRDLLDARGKGISVLEIAWEHRPAPPPGQGLIIAPRCTRWVHPSWYGYPNGANDSTLMLRSSPAPFSLQPSAFSLSTNWQPFPDHKFLIAILKNKTGHPLGSALLHVLGFWWAASNFTADWFLNYAQVFGQPFRWATYDPNISGSDLAKLQAMLSSMGAQAWGMFPQGTAFELKETAKGASENIQAALLAIADKVCDTVVLGQTLTTDAADSGSRALGEVHERVLSGVKFALANWTCKTLQQLVDSIVSLNFGDDQLSPSIIPGMQEKTSADQVARLLVAVHSSGLEPTDPAIQKISDCLGFSVRRQRDAASPPAPIAASAIPDSGARTFLSARDSLQNSAAAQLGVPTEWLDPIRNLFADLEQKASDRSLSDQDLLSFLDQAAQSIPELFAQLDLDELARILEAGLGDAVLDSVRQRLRQRPNLAAASK